MSGMFGTSALRRSWLALAIFAATAFLSLRVLADLAASVDDAGRAQATARAADQLAISLGDLEAGQVRFVLTGDQGALTAYQAARVQVDAAVGAVQAARAADPDRRAALDTIGALATARLAEIGRAVELRQAGEERAALALTQPQALGGPQRSLADDLRRRLADLRADEQAALAHRADAAQLLGRWGLAGIVGGSALLLVLVAARRDRPSGGVDEQASRAGVAASDHAADGTLSPSAVAVATVFQSATDALLVLDAQHQIVQMNGAAEQLLGCSAETARGAPATRFLLDAAPAAGADEQRSQAITGSSIWQGGGTTLLTARRPDGTTFPAEVTLSVAAVNGAAHYLAFVRDASGRLPIEEELRATRQQLEQAQAEAQQTQEVMIRQERLKSLGQLASGIVHDFNNALSMIIGFTELMLSETDAESDPEKRRTHLHLIHSAAQDAAGVVARLREFSRPSSATDALPPVQVNDLVAQAISLSQPRWRDQAQASGQTIRVAAELGAVPTIGGRASDLREALANLIINAVDAMPQGGTLTLRSRVDDGMVIVEVADTGIGMSPDVRDHIFDPFYTTKGDHGTGLGLPMVHSIIEQHHGEIVVNSASGLGTTFQLRFPPLAGTAIPSDTDGPAPAVARPTPPRVRGLRVLLTEDEPSLRQILMSYLRVDGHAIEMASNGKEALAKYSADAFDLVITDRAMPEMGGDALAAEIRRSGATTPIIMLTGLGDMMNETGERPAGVDLVVSKPVTLAELRAAVVTVTGGDRVTVH